MLALGACGTAAKHKGHSSGSVTQAAASCESAYVDWLYFSGRVRCSEANTVAAAIFMGRDGNERTSFLREDFTPLPTVKVAGVGYLPTRVLRSWHCRYRTRRSSYAEGAVRPSFDASGTLRLVSATCVAEAAVVEITTTTEHGTNRRNS